MARWSIKIGADVAYAEQETQLSHEALQLICAYYLGCSLHASVDSMSAFGLCPQTCNTAGRYCRINAARRRSTFAAAIQTLARYSTQRENTRTLTTHHF